MTSESHHQPLTLAAFRRDVDMSQQGETSVVKDRETQRFYSFGQAETFIINQLDGKTSPEEIIVKTRAILGAELDMETLRVFYHGLWTRGLLEDENYKPAPMIISNSRIKGTPLYLRFNIHNPDQQLIRLHKALPWIFHRWFHFISILIIALATLIFISNGDEVTRDFTQILTLGSIAPAWIVILLTTTCHEYAHGLTCKHYGGEVTEMGFILLFFQPGMYVNVSDSWLFPEKNKRIRVMLAGVVFEIILWALAIIFWRISAPETLISYVALLILGTSGVRLFLNLNPLIKLDGYYALSDWLEIPNLRQKSLGYFINRLRHPFSKPTQDTGRRHRRIFFYYGLFSALFSVWIITVIASVVAGYLTNELQGIGFILFLCLLAVVLKGPLTKLKTKLFAQKHTETDIQVPEKSL